MKTFQNQIRYNAHMNETSAVQNIYIGFWVSVVLKGLISVAEVAGGIVILFIPTDILTALAQSFFDTGILGDPNGFLAMRFMQTLGEFTSATQTFVAIYLLVRGLIKSLVLGAVISNKLWAYPASLMVLGALVAFQAYQILSTHSLVVTCITIFDLVVMYFVYCEYLIVKAHHGVRKEHFSTGTE